MQLYSITSSEDGLKKEFGPNLPKVIADGLKDIFRIKGSDKDTMDAIFLKLSDWEKIVLTISNQNTSALKIAGSVINELKQILSPDTIISFATSEFPYHTLLELRMIANGLCNGFDKPKCLDNFNSMKRQAAELGYNLRRFTDLGFDYTLPGDRERCRFCEAEAANGATFAKDAHAISYFLGNHGLLGSGECDVCNDRFGRELEPHLDRYYKPTAIRNGFDRARGKDPHIKGINFKQDRSELVMNLDAHDIQQLRLMEKGGVGWFQQVDNQPFKRAAIYRILCKYVVSVLNDIELPDYKKTIAWINGKYRTHRLPNVYRYEKFSAVSIPILDVYTLNQSNRFMPQCIGVLRFYSNIWIWAMPYAIEGVDNQGMERGLEKFINHFFTNLEMVKEDFTIEKDMYVQTHFTISGESSKFTSYANMTPQEQADFKSRTPHNPSAISQMVITHS